MSKEKSVAMAAIQELEDLEARTEKVEINLTNLEGKSLLDEYLQENKRVKVNFNDFLKTRKGIKNKVVVAEITGGTLSDVDGANFTGCSFKNIEFEAMSNVSFRDAVFDGVRIMGGDYADIDFRGVEISNCEFFSGGNRHALNNVQLAFADPNTVQDKGVFRVEDTDNPRLFAALEKLEFRLRQEESQKIKEYLEEENANAKASQYRAVGLVKWAAGWERDPSEFGKSFKLQDLPLNQQEHIKGIHQEYQQKLERESETTRAGYFVRVKNPNCDPTYTPNQTAERAAAIRESFVATREDLELYLKGNKSIPFNDFITAKYSDTFTRAKAANQSKEVVAIATFASDTNLSGLDLSGADLRGINLAYCNLDGCNLNKAKLGGTCFEGCSIKGANFDEANLMDCNMIGVMADENTSFTKSNMIRVRAHVSDLRGVSMDGVVAYGTTFKDSDMGHAKLVGADIRRSNLSGVNLRYVDARFAQMQGATLIGAVADEAQIMHANLSRTIADGFSARKANLEHAVMDGMRAHYADLRAADLRQVQASGVSFSYADLKEIKARRANFEGAILDKADAAFADFGEATMTDVRAWSINLINATADKVQAQRIDIRGAVIEGANLQAADLSNAIMQEIRAGKANLKNAFLREANLQRAALVGADLRNADLSKAEAQGAVLMAADLEGARVDHMKLDVATILIDANLRGIIGDDKTINALRMQQEEQHKLQEQWLGRSRYGGCSKNDDGSNDRFICQRLGAMVLSSAIGGGAGVTLAGPLAGIQTAALSAMISDNVLVASKDHYFSDLGYINNALGDRLAEVGAIALSMGVGAADKSIDGAAAGLVCTMAGMVNGAVLGAVGVGTTLGGLNLAIKGVQENSRWKKFAGTLLTGIGAAASFFGFSSLGGSISTVAYGAAIGGVTGALWAGTSAVKRLYVYDEKAPSKGARPERIYRESLAKSTGIWKKLVPTMRKVFTGIVLGIGAAALGTAVVASLPFIGAFAFVKLAITANVAMTSGTVGFLGGYLYDDKVAALASRMNPFKRMAKQGQSMLEPAKHVEAVQEVTKTPSLQVAKNKALEVSDGEFAKRYPKKPKMVGKPKRRTKFANEEESRRIEDTSKREATPPAA